MGRPKLGRNVWQKSTEDAPPPHPTTDGNVTGQNPVPKSGARTVELSISEPVSLTIDTSVTVTVPTEISATILDDTSSANRIFWNGSNDTVWNQSARSLLKSPSPISDMGPLSPYHQARLLNYSFGIGLPLSETIFAVCDLLDDGGYDVDHETLADSLAFFLDNVYLVP